jgi:hypothetical protein
MHEFFEAWGSTLREIGLGGFAVYALLNVWKRLLEMTDIHRVDSQKKDKEHRAELGELERKHVENINKLNAEHRANVMELILRNMDEHRERNRVMVLGWRATAEAFARNDSESPDPYPDVDIMGKDDPRK